MGMFPLGLKLIVASLVDKISQSTYRKLVKRILVGHGVEVSGLPLWVSPRVFFDLSKPGSIKIGHRVVISHYVRLLTHDFSMDRADEYLHGRQPLELSLSAPIVIEDLVFIGLGSTVLPGVTIGKGAIVGAGSVVTKNVGPGLVVAGNPARVVRSVEEHFAINNAKFSRGIRRP